MTMNSEQIKLVHCYFDLITNAGGSYPTDPLYVSAYTHHNKDEEIFGLLTCKKCFSLVRDDKMIGHAEWHERLIVG